MKADRDIFSKKLVFIEKKMKFFEEELAHNEEENFLTSGEVEYFEKEVASLANLYTFENNNYEVLEKKVFDLNFQNYQRAM